MVFGGSTFVWWLLYYEDRDLMNETSSFIKVNPKSSLTSSTTWGHSEKTTSCESESRISPGTKSSEELFNTFHKAFFSNFILNDFKLREKLQNNRKLSLPVISLCSPWCAVYPPRPVGNKPCCCFFQSFLMVIA